MPEGSESELGGALARIESLRDDIRDLKSDIKELQRQGDVKDVITRLKTLEDKVAALGSWKTYVLGGFAVISFIFMVLLASAT